LWRLVTPVFLHFGVLHILFNMMWLRNLGGAIEFVRGTRRFLLLFLLLAVISNVAQLLWSGPRFGGMSGVVFGLIGYVWMKGRTQPHLGLGLTSDQIVYSVLWLVLCMGGAMGNIANAAHLAGFIAGILVGSRHALIRKLRHILQ
jgi:GlpG protein